MVTFDVNAGIVGETVLEGIGRAADLGVGAVASTLELA